MTTPEMTPVPVRLHPDDLDALIKGQGKIRKRRSLRTNTFTLTAANATQAVLPQANNRAEAWITSAVGPAPVTVPATGTQTNPGAGTVICSATLAPGIWTVNWTVVLTGTIAAADLDNFGLYLNGVLIATSVNTSTAQPQPQPPIILTVPPGAGQVLAIESIGASSAGGVVYRAQFAAELDNLPPVVFIAPTQAGASGQGGGSAQINGTDTTPFPVNTTDQVWASAAAEYPVTVSVVAIYEEDE